MPVSRKLVFNSSYAGNQSHPISVSAGSVYGYEIEYKNGEVVQDLSGYSVTFKIYRYGEVSEDIVGVSSSGNAVFDVTTDKVFKDGRWVATAESGGNSFIIGKGDFYSREAK